MNEQKTFVSGRFLLCFASVIGICAAVPVHGAEPAKPKIDAAAAATTKSGIKAARESKEDFQRQDNAAAKSLSLVNEARLLAANEKYREADKKYSDAVINLQDNVLSILELQISEVDSWRSRQRYEEFSKMLAQIQAERGVLKMEQAEKAMLSGDYDSAIILANDAKNANPAPAWETKTMEFIRLAVGKKNSAERNAMTAAETSDPGIKLREKDIKRYLAEAWVFYRNGRYKEAMDRVEDVYALNPYNADAAYLASQIWKKFYIAGKNRRDADIKAQLAYEAWQWVEPAFPIAERSSQSGEGEKGIVKGRSDAAIQMKLDQIRLSTVPFNEMNLEEAIRFINSQSKKDDPDGTGVIVELLVTAKKKAPVDKNLESGDNPGGPVEGGDDEGDYDDSEESFDDSEGGSEENAVASEAIFVTAELKNVSVRELLNYLSQITGMSYVVRDDRVVFGSEDSELETKEYSIANAVKAMITGKTFKIYDNAGGAAPADAPAEDEFADDEFADDTAGGDPAGGDVDPAAADPAGGTATPEVSDSELTPEAIQKFFELYGVEFPEGSSVSYYKGDIVMRNTAEEHRRMESILKRINSESDMIEVEVKSIEIAESDMEELGFNWSIGTISKGKWKLGKGENTSSTGEGAMLKMLDGLLSGVDSRLVSNLNFFPDIFGSFKPFGIDETLNLSLTINALDRSDRTEQISAPRVLVANGVTATVKMTKAYFFPEEWEEMEVETDDAGETEYQNITISAPKPSFGESANDIGTVFTVTPTIKAGGKVINLKLSPTITAYTGKDEYEVVVKVENWDGGKRKWVVDEDRSKNFVVWRPVIATRALTVDVNVNHGETLVIGGLSDSQSQKRLDKIPILADIPFIGRLFQNQSEISTRRNMLIFVTARLVDHKGMPRPLESRVGNGGIPALVR